MGHTLNWNKGTVGTILPFGNCFTSLPRPVLGFGRVGINKRLKGRGTRKEHAGCWEGDGGKKRKGKKVAEIKKVASALANSGKIPGKLYFQIFTLVRHPSPARSPWCTASICKLSSIHQATALLAFSKRPTGPRNFQESCSHRKHPGDQPAPGTTIWIKVSMRTQSTRATWNEHIYCTWFHKITLNSSCMFDIHIIEALGADSTLCF